MEKPASKGHGFFGLFDWGKKSKKRLFVGSASSSPDPSKQIGASDCCILVYILQGVWLSLHANLSFFTENAGDGKDVDDSTPSTRSNSVSALPQIFAPVLLSVSRKVLND